MKDFDELISIAKKLRSKNGCPWDKKQTIASMLPHLESEVAEIREAVEKEDWENLEEEIGDVLFNLVMIAQIAAEEKKFRMSDVLRGEVKKIKARHTWVFGKDKGTVKNAEEALAKWQENKKKLRDKKKD